MRFHLLALIQTRKKGKLSYKRKIFLKNAPFQERQFVEKVFSTNCEWKSAKAVFHSIHHIYCKNGFPAL